MNLVTAINRLAKSAAYIVFLTAAIFHLHNKIGAGYVSMYYKNLSLSSLKQSILSQQA